MAGILTRKATNLVFSQSSFHYRCSRILRTQNCRSPLLRIQISIINMTYVGISPCILHVLPGIRPYSLIPSGSFSFISVTNLISTFTCRVRIGCCSFPCSLTKVIGELSSQLRFESQFVYHGLSACDTQVSFQTLFCISWPRSDELAWHVFLMSCN